MPSIITEVRSRLLTAPTEEQHQIRNINSTFYNAIISFTTQL